MYFVGLDLAWGEKNQTGVAVINAEGRLLHVGVAAGDDSIEAVLAPYARQDCLVAIDAPLIVPNERGARPCEVALNRDFAKFQAGARPAFKARPEFNPPRAKVLAKRLGLDPNPASTAPRRAIEVFPHPASIVLFGLPITLKYKKGAFGTRQRALLELMSHIEGLDDATPRLRVNHNASWVELRKRVEAATRPSHLDRDEDPVDAVICAYVALFWYHRPDDVTVYGDYASGYIVTPTLPPETRPEAPPETQPERRSPAPPSVGDRLAQVAALLEEAQLELAAIREHLGT